MNGRPVVAVVVAVAVLLANAAVAVAQEPVASVDWASTPPLSGEVVGGNARVTADPNGGSLPVNTTGTPPGSDVRAHNEQGNTLPGSLDGTGGQTNAQVGGQATSETARRILTGSRSSMMRQPVK